MKFLLLFFFSASVQAQTKIALNWKAEPQFGGFYQASLNPENKIELIQGGSGTPTIQMLSFGKVDYAVVSAEEILISNDKNPKNPVVAVFATFQKNPQALITTQDRNLKSIGDILKSPGIVAVQSGLTYVSFLKKKYPEAKQIKWVPYLGGVGGLLNEKQYTQQGFITSEPLLAEKKGAQVSSFLIADEGFNPYTTVLAVRKSDLVSKKTEIQKVVQALQKGWTQYLENPSPTNQHMAKLNPSMDTETFKKSADVQKVLIESKDGLGKMSEVRWQQLIETLLELKIIKKKQIASEQFSLLFN